MGRSRSFLQRPRASCNHFRERERTMRAKTKLKLLVSYPLILLLFQPVFGSPTDNPELPDIFSKKIAEINQEFSQEFQRLLAERDEAIRLAIKEAYQEEICRLQKELSDKECTICSSKAHAEEKEIIEAAKDDISEKVELAEEDTPDTDFQLEEEQEVIEEPAELVSPVESVELTPKSEIETETSPSEEVADVNIPESLENQDPEDESFETTPEDFVSQTDIPEAQPLPSTSEEGQAKVEPVSATETEENAQPETAITPASEESEETTEEANPFDYEEENFLPESASELDSEEIDETEEASSIEEADIFQEEPFTSAEDETSVDDNQEFEEELSSEEETETEEELSDDPNESDFES